MEWQISDQDIQAAEELLLPHGAHFPEDARNVIRCWHSTDVAALSRQRKNNRPPRKAKAVGRQNATRKRCRNLCALSYKCCCR